MPQRSGRANLPAAADIAGHAFLGCWLSRRCNSLDAEEIAEECSRRCKHFVGAFAPKVRSLELGKADGGKGDAKRFI